MTRNLKNIMNLIDCANEVLPIEQQFVNDLKASIEKRACQDNHKHSQTIKPSSFQCIRNAYYQLIGEEPTKDNKSYQLEGICESGTDRHIRMQQNIERMKETINADCEYIDVEDFVKQRNLTDLEIVGKDGMETKLYNKRYNISFRCDGIIKYKSKYFVFEFKTETSNKFYKRKDVDESHHNQAIMYSINFGIDQTIFLYENRDDCSLKCYIFNITNKMKQDIIGNIELLEENVKKLKAPAKPLNVLKKTCRVLFI